MAQVLFPPRPPLPKEEVHYSENKMHSKGTLALHFRIDATFSNFENFHAHRGNVGAENIRS